MPKYTMSPWIQNEDGLTLVPARDANYTGPVQGLVDLISQNELHVVTTTQKFPVGSLVYDVGSDSKYRYVEFGGTTAAGDMVQAEAPDAAHDALDPSGSGTSAGVTKGSTIISIADSITLVENEYTGGHLLTQVNGAGLGYRYPIKSNAAGATTDLNVTLWEPGLAVAINATTDVALVKSRYKEVIEAPATLTGVPVGAGLGVGADGSFGWVQTRGPAAVLTAGTVVIGNNVVVVTTAGAVGPAPSDVLPVVGWVVDVGATTTFSLIFLTLE